MLLWNDGGRCSLVNDDWNMGEWGIQDGGERGWIRDVMPLVVMAINQKNARESIGPRFNSWRFRFGFDAVLDERDF